MKLTLELTGDCNLCGLCCTQEINGVLYVCEHLATTARPLGMPLATTCRVYGERVDGMAISLRGPDGNRATSQCWKGSVNEALGIVTRGIGRGCSLEVRA